MDHQQQNPPDPDDCEQQRIIKVSHAEGDVLYDLCINAWREDLGSGNKISNINVLPRPPRDDADTKYVHVRFVCERESQEYTCTGKFKYHDLYLIGIQNRKGDWFDLSESGVDFGTSTPLPVGITYGDLLTASEMSSLDITPKSGVAIRDAITFISKLDKDTNLNEKKQLIASSLLTLILVFCEAARFNSIKRHVREKWFAEGDCILGHEDLWMQSVVHNWKNMSLLLIEDDKNGGRTREDLNQKVVNYQIKVGRDNFLTSVEDVVREIGIIKQKKPKKRGKKTRHRVKSSRAGESSRVG
ncbi:unnamed protein product [Cuscuta europaea]|uniref:rRNA N-glycosylase n=1 Tax=Cuscuta europaea TaxID=41803 RepID=A0A9P1DYY7_CUSEU|nr:unnamed protein product [Cuscuta europaea]